MSIPNPIQILEQVGKLANVSSKVAALQKIDKMKADGGIGADGTPDYQNLMNMCKQFVADLDKLNKDGQSIMKLEAELTEELKAIMEQQK